MCGIAGIVGDGASAHADSVDRMVDALRHRGPDGEGTFLSPSGRCVLGHTRLSILDLTERASQPMCSPDGRLTLTYNGECYNFRELRDELSASGESFTSSGDAEVVLHMLARYGKEALPRLNGMFAFAVWDEWKQHLLLARDRFGQKPLYFACSRGLFVFASEVRAILASGLIPRRLDLQGVCGFLSFGAVQRPHAIVTGVAEMEPASYRAVSADGRESSGCYWRPPRDKVRRSANELREAFAAAIRRHLVSDVPIGLFLSGGVDSSAAVVAAAHASVSKIRTLTVVFPDQPGRSEASHARRVAELAGAEHNEVPVTGKEMLSLLPTALNAVDQPTFNGINTFVVSHTARQAGLKVALSGVGGDELFGGYSSFSDVPALARLRHLVGPLARVAGPLVARWGRYSKRWSKVADLMDAMPGVLCAYLVRRRLFAFRQIAVLAPALASDTWLSGVDQARMITLRSLIAGRKTADAVGLLEMDTYMEQVLLRDSDFMGMANGLEIRLPFLDAEFAGAALALEVDARVCRHVSKDRFVKAMGDWLPTENTRRPKQGFTLPFREWMLQDIRESVQDGIEILARIGEPFRPDAVRAVWNAFERSPDRVGWSRPWALFVLGRYVESQRLVI